MRIYDFYMTAPLYEPPDFTSREFGFRKNGEKELERFRPCI
jgi:hypothetical protein